MRGLMTRFVAAAAIGAFAIGVGAAQDRPAAPSNDPRVGLKPGFKDAGVVASNMALVANLPKPPGFFDPKAPSGLSTEPDQTVSGFQ